MPEKQIDFQLKLADGKYTYIFYKDGSSEALRHGQPWQDTTGNNLIHALAHTLNETLIILANLMEQVRASPALTADIGMNLVDHVRQAQVRAGEQAVIDRLNAMNLAKKITGKE